MSNRIVETHAFGDFIPPTTKYLMLGSFTAKRNDDSYHWFYATKRNKFWPILENVYNINLDKKEEKLKLFTKLGIAMADIIRQCERNKGNNSDNNLVHIVYNTEMVDKIVRENKIKRIFFSSRLVEKEFKRLFNDLIEEFPQIKLIYLPSPSPRYAAMSFEEKVKRYKEVFPSL